MERLREGARSVWERLLDGVVYMMQSPYLPYSEFEAGGRPPTKGRIPQEQEPIIEEEPEQTPE